MRSKVSNYLNSLLLLSRMSKCTRKKASYNVDELLDYLLESDEEGLGQLEDSNDGVIPNIMMMMITLFQLQLTFLFLELTRIPSWWNLLYRKRDQIVKETLVL